MREPTAMAMATSDAHGRPSVRMLLLKHADERGFVFYTNLGSPKIKDLKENPRAALCFYWMPLGKQVRVEGPVEAVSDEEADAYFATRPRLSQLGAWASVQSQPMPDRIALERKVAIVAARHALRKVPRPPFWSGYRVIPDRIEFWEERPFRRHRRVLYSKTNDAWKTELLFP